MTRDERFIKEAILEAEKALKDGEVPVGAVIVKGNEIIARGRNSRETQRSPLGHAEINAISEASRVLGDWRLDGCELFVTLEPCAMCAGAINASRIRRVVFGAFDPDFGCMGSALDLSRLPNSRVEELLGGILDTECKALMNRFFESSRKGSEEEL